MRHTFILHIYHMLKARHSILFLLTVSGKGIFKTFRSTFYTTQAISLSLAMYALLFGLILYSFLT